MGKKIKKNIFLITVYDFKENKKEKSIIQFPLSCLSVNFSGSGKTRLLLNFISKNWVLYKNLCF